MALYLSLWSSTKASTNLGICGDIEGSWEDGQLLSRGSEVRVFGLPLQGGWSVRVGQRGSSKDRLNARGKQLHCKQGDTKQ